MDYTKTLYSSIDLLKESLRNEVVTSDGLSSLLNSHLGHSVDQHDLDLVMQYIRSPVSSIKEYLIQSNSALHVVDELDYDGKPLETIFETTESSSTQSKTNISTSTLGNPFTMDTAADLSSTPAEPNASASIDQSASFEYETVRMIRMKRMDTGLQSIHRIVFLDVPSLSESEQDSLVEGLKQTENGFASIVDYSFYEVKDGDKAKLEFPANRVLNMVWNIEQQPEKVVESVLFSSWKTKVNHVLQRLWNKNALGFVDISKEGLNMYE